MSGLTVISDGADGFTAKVDELRRLTTFATIQADSTAASLNGDTFFISHPVINLTSDAESYVIYVENIDTVDWVVNEFATDYGPSTGGIGDFLTRFVSNPTGGTLIDSGSDAFAANMNLAQPQTLSGTFKYGAEGSTITGGTNVPQGLVVSDTRAGRFTGGPIVIGPGTKFALSVTPPTGNTDMNVQVSIILHREGIG